MAKDMIIVVLIGIIGLLIVKLLDMKADLRNKDVVHDKAMQAGSAKVAEVMCHLLTEITECALQYIPTEAEQQNFLADCKNHGKAYGFEFIDDDKEGGEKK